MESSTSRTDAAFRKQEEIKSQIAALQAQLSSFPDDDDTVVLKDPNSPKRKKPEPTTLAPATPSPSESYHKHCHIPLSLTSRKETANRSQG
jgi:minichromosome maintenance protein 10